MVVKEITVKRSAFETALSKTSGGQYEKNCYFPSKKNEKKIINSV